MGAKRDTNKHTPGPWRVGLDGRYIMGGASYIAEVLQRRKMTADKMAANAALIAAAPDLLLVLLRVKTDMLRDDFESENARCDYVLAYVGAALAKVGT